MSIRVAVGVILEGSKVLIALRPKDKHKGGYWEFPGGKVEQGETTLEALQRELKEEVGIEFTHADPLLDIHWSYSEKDVVLEVMTVKKFTKKLDLDVSDVNSNKVSKGNEGQDIRWIEVSDLPSYKFPEANGAIVDNLLARINNNR